jgi:two-component system cell cycle sensor histidine kinase/response regulator CckA
MAGTRTSAQVEQRFVRRDRTTIVLRVSLSTIAEEGGPPAGVAVTCEDVTAQREAERVLYLREAHLRDLFDTVPVGMFHAAPDGTILAVNSALRQLLSYERTDTLTGMTVARLCADVDAEADVRAVQSGCHVTVRRTETRFRCSDGRPLTVVISVRAVTDARGDVVYHEGVVLDIVDRTMLDMQCLQAQKQDTFGLLVTDVVHNFKNLLTSVSGHAELMLRQLDTQRSDLGEIMKASHRAADLARQVMIFGRRDTADDRLLDMNSVVERVGIILAWLFTQNIRLRQRLAPDLLPVQGDASHLEQVLINLALNARDAMPDGGELTFETANVGANVMAGGVPQVRIVVRDTGVGMDERVRAQLFKPFFTTKTSDKGTGLGLYTVDRIITRLGGAVRVESRVGRGTAFLIDLPASEEVGGQLLMRNCSASVM